MKQPAFIPHLRLLLIAAVLLVGSTSSSAQPSGQQSAELEADQREFFENRVRPVLVNHCYECHNSVDSAEGGLTLDHRAGWQKGGEGGPVILVLDPTNSRLLKMIRHEVEGMEMPSGGPKLSEDVIADFERWIASGAYDPRDAPPTADELAETTSWEAQLKQRKQWWSFQPIQHPRPPESPDSQNAASSIDRFLQAKRDDQKLAVSPPADNSVLVRRLFFVLTGLPATTQETQRWVAALDNSTPETRQAKVGELVDDLLKRPAFAERWARHWMDWVRYAESHGSEGDPEIVGAWQYRDYLIRAIDQDVPMDQLIREHIAGDLLKKPRLNTERQWNESAIGPSHLRMVFHGFAPTDALDEKVRFTDDQINVVSKAFLGLTVSCARCHDHKFDAISQKDYYALFGIFASCRPGRTVIDASEPRAAKLQRLQQQKQNLREPFITHWKQSLSREKLLSFLQQTDSQNKNLSSLKLLAHLCDAERNQNTGTSSKFSGPSDSNRIDWNLADPEIAAQWHSSRQAGPATTTPAGTFFFRNQNGIHNPEVLSGGIYSSVLTDKLGHRLTSPSFEVKADDRLWVLARGYGNATLRYVVHNYPRNGTVYPVINLTPDWKWHQLDISYWQGEEIHVELTTALDAPLLVKQNERSWFGIQRVIVQPQSAAPPVLPKEALQAVAAGDFNPPPTTDQMAQILFRQFQDALDAIKSNNATDANAMLVNELLASGLLPAAQQLPSSIKQSAEQLIHTEGSLPVATRVPGLDDAEPRDSPLFVRGDHRQPTEIVPRRFLEAIDSTPYDNSGSGRRQLAEDLLREDNPLTRRVLVNRLWHHVFGHGIVRTPDNFGRLGAQPSHPLLLDWLANELPKRNWSLKSMVRLMVMTEAFQLSSTPSEKASDADPQNLWLTHSNVRRLEAEAIRDLLISLTGQRDQSIGGPPVSPQSMRRSIYLKVRRNDLNPFLRTFDFPEPSATVGRRNATNVPAQSLTMLNDPFAGKLAEQWAQRTLQLSGLSNENDSSEEPETSSIIRAMFEESLGRPPKTSEVKAAIEFWSGVRDQLLEQQRHRQHLLDRRDKFSLELAEHRQVVADRLQEKTGDKSKENLQKPPGNRIHHWDFHQPLPPGHSLQLHGQAKMTPQGLNLPGQSWAAVPLAADVQEKTLTATVQLSNLNQRAGGVISIQSRSGQIFDAIVFAEQQPAEWLAGSNNFSRTQGFQGPKESQAQTEPVHVAITWSKEGKVTAYRNGQLYGRPYQIEGLPNFAAQDSVVTLGLRHLPASPGRFLNGTIKSASLFDRCLNAQEVESLVSLETGNLTLASLLEAMTSKERSHDQHLVNELEATRQQLKDLGPPGQGSIRQQVVTQLAKSMFLLQELIYVR